MKKYEKSKHILALGTASQLTLGGGGRGTEESGKPVRYIMCTFGKASRITRGYGTKVAERGGRHGW
jgi:hypothetical protein